jgi:hypothetical protein
MQEMSVSLFLSLLLSHLGSFLGLKLEDDLSRVGYHRSSQLCVALLHLDEVVGSLPPRLLPSSPLVFVLPHSFQAAHSIHPTTTHKVGPTHTPPSLLPPASLPVRKPNLWSRSRLLPLPRGRSLRLLAVRRSRRVLAVAVSWSRGSEGREGCLLYR